MSLPAGDGQRFKDAMDKFIKEIRVDIQNTFKNSNFESEKNQIVQKYQEKRDKLLENLNKKSAKYGFVVKSADNGVYMMPVVDGKVIKEEEFNELDADVKKEYEDKSTIVQEQIIQVIQQIKELDAESEKKVSEWQANIALFTIEGHTSICTKSNFKRNKKINKFLDGVKKDIIKNINTFIDQPKQDENDKQKMPEEMPWDNYSVNLFVDNSNVQGAPVIMDSDYSFIILFW